jgi:nitrite reductase/ring-hydroxylating ferredoxin subunit
MWSRACTTDDLVPGGVTYVRLGEVEVLVCNVDGAFHAVGRRCGHVHAPLERGSLDGPYLTCPVHYVQFDVRSGEALSKPVSRRHAAPKPDDDHVHDLPTYAVREREGVVEVEIPDAG